MASYQFGKNLKSRRIQFGLSQRELAENICAQSILSQYESGQVIPTVDIASRLANRLHTTVSNLMEEGVGLKKSQTYDDAIFQWGDQKDYDRINDYLVSKGIEVLVIDEYLMARDAWLVLLLKRSTGHFNKECYQELLDLVGRVEGDKSKLEYALLGRLYYTYLEWCGVDGLQQRATSLALEFEKKIYFERFPKQVQVKLYSLMSEVFREAGSTKKAIENLRKAIRISSEDLQLVQLASMNRKLADLYKQIGQNQAMSLHYENADALLRMIQVEALTDKRG